MTVLLVTPLPAAVEAHAAARYGAVAASRPMAVDDIVSEATRSNVRAILLGSRQRIGRTEIARMPRSVGLIATCSVGFDHIDGPAAAERMIAVTNTPDVVTDATADLTLLLILGAARRAREYMAVVQAGWRRTYALNEMLGTDLAGKTLGIVGMGRIGRAVSRRAAAFGMRIAYHNRSRLEPSLEQDARYVAALDDLIAISDVLSLNLPSAGSTPLMTGARFMRMKKGAIFVNAACGSLVDEDAPLEALASGHLASAGLDVFQKEPDYDLRFRDEPRAFLTPHIGSATIETREAMGMRALSNIDAFLEGRVPVDLVNHFKR